MIIRITSFTSALIILLPIAPPQCWAAAPTKKHFLEQGQRVDLAPGVVLVAGEDGPFVLFGKERDYAKRNFLYLDKKIDIWNGGTRAQAELLGIKRNVLRPQFVVQITTDTAPPVLSKQDTSGGCQWSYNNPRSNRDRLNFATVSKAPLLMVGSAGSESNELLVVTNYGVAALSSDRLRPSAIMFKRDTGEMLVCPWNEKMRDYDIPASARGHGIIKGPVDGKPSITTKIGPSTVVLATEYPGSKFTATLTVDKTQQGFKGPYILAYEVPDFYSASLGLPTYVEDTPASAPRAAKRYYKPDNGFPAAWQLRLNPPITEEYGLGPNGPAMGEAVIHCTLWKFGDTVYGNGGYSYSDCGLQKSGQIEGTIAGNKMSLTMTGSLNMQLDGPAPSATSGCKGTAIVSDSITGRSIVTATGKLNPLAANKREFTLSPGNNTSSTGSARDRFLSQIDLIPPNTEYWNAICALPGNYGSESILQNTIRLVKEEQNSPDSGREVLYRCGDLAHMQYCAWLESANSRGKNHPITLAHAEIAEKLYKRILESKRSRSQHHLKNYIKMLTATGKVSEAKSVEEEMKKLPKD